MIGHLDRHDPTVSAARSLHKKMHRLRASADLLHGLRYCVRFAARFQSWKTLNSRPGAFGPNGLDRDRLVASRADHDRLFQLCAKRMRAQMNARRLGVNCLPGKSLHAERHRGQGLSTEGCGSQLYVECELAGWNRGGWSDPGDESAGAFPFADDHVAVGRIASCLKAAKRDEPFQRDIPDGDRTTKNNVVSEVHGAHRHGQERACPAGQSPGLRFTWSPEACSDSQRNAAVVARVVCLLRRTPPTSAGFNPGTQVDCQPD